MYKNNSIKTSVVDLVNRSSERGNGSIASATQAAFWCVAGARHLVVPPSEMNHVPLEAWLFNHGWRPRSILSRVLWQMLESAPQMKKLTFHHLIRY